MRYLTKAGCSVECLLELVPVPDTSVEIVSSNIVSTLECRGIDLSKIVWKAFDGASNMSGLVFRLDFERRNALKLFMCTAEAIYCNLPMCMLLRS